MTTRRSPVRVLTVCGSLQARSANRSALVVAAAAIGAAGGSVDDYDALAAVPPFNPDREDPPLPEVLDWRRRVTAADAVLVSVPEYAGGLAGTVKNALDWLVGTAELYRKLVAVMSAGTSG